MPVEFVHDVSDAKDAYKLVMAYDGSGRRVSKTRMVKDDQRGYWYTDHVTHYTGIGTEVRESIRRAASPEVKVVVNLPQGLGRYGVEDAADPFKGIDKDKLAGYIPSAKFEWYLKNHLGSTMLVYGTSAYDDSYFSKYQGGVQAAYDYRAFGEQVDLQQKGDKVTENFTGKERDDETELNYFGARYLDPMLGLWVSVDPKRQFSSPYLYMGNGVNPIIGFDPNGNEVVMDEWTKSNYVSWLNSNVGGPESKMQRQAHFAALEASDQVYHIRVKLPVDGLDVQTKGMYDPEVQAVMYDGSMENFFHELLAHTALDEAIYEKAGIPLGESNWFEPENGGRENFLNDEIRARGIGNSQTPANLPEIIDEYGAIYDMHYGETVTK